VPGKKAAALAQSPAASYLRRINAEVLEFPAPEAMYQALLVRMTALDA